MKFEKIRVIESNDSGTFMAKVNTLLEQGGIISSTSCGFVPSQKYDFCNVFHAIIIMPKEETI